MGFSRSFLDGLVQDVKGDGRYIEGVGAAVFLVAVNVPVDFLGQVIGLGCNRIPGTYLLYVFGADFHTGRYFPVGDAMVAAIAFIHDTIAGILG